MSSNSSSKIFKDEQIDRGVLQGVADGVPLIIVTVNPATKRLHFAGTDHLITMLKHGFDMEHYLAEKLKQTREQFREVIEQ